MSSAAAIAFVLVAISLYDVIDGVCFLNSTCSRFYHIQKFSSGFQEHRLHCDNLLSLTTGNGTLSYVELSDGSSVVRGISGGQRNNRLMVFEAARGSSDVDGFIRRFAAAALPGGAHTSTCVAGSSCVNSTVGPEVADHGLVDVEAECDRARSALKLAIKETERKRGERTEGETDRAKITSSGSVQLLQQMVVKLRDEAPHAVGHGRPEDGTQLTGQSSVGRRRSRPRRNLLFPGTRWCGVGNSSTEQESVGAIVPVDKCCQEHDSCEHTIDGFSTKYNLYNFRFHTLSHCECDDRFRTCLRALGDSHADEIGRWFFNYIGMRCFVFRRERVCAQRTWWGQCTKYTLQPTAVVHDTPLTY